MSAGREPCPIHRPMPCSSDCPNSTEAHVRRAVRDLQAVAWEQGYMHADDDYERVRNGGAAPVDALAANPYRTPPSPNPESETKP